jgi:hypothetical protein
MHRSLEKGILSNFGPLSPHTFRKSDFAGVMILPGATFVVSATPVCTPRAATMLIRSTIITQINCKRDLHSRISYFDQFMIVPASNKGNVCQSPHVHLRV